MAETNEPAAPAEPAVPKLHATSMLRRRNIAVERPVAPNAEVGEHLANLVDSVRVLSGHLGAESSAPESRDRSTRRIKKFQRAVSADEPATEEPPAAQPDAVPAQAGTARASEISGEAALNKSVAWPQVGRTSKPARPAQARRRGNRRNKIIVALVVQALGFGLLALGYWLGQGSSAVSAAVKSAAPPRSNPPDPAAPRRVSERAFQTATAALHAEKQGDLDRARHLYETAIRDGMGLQGANYRLALLDAQNRDFERSDIHLMLSINAGESVAPCCYLGAILYNAGGKLPSATRELQTAAYAEPFSAKYLFYWGEALRREGKITAAIPVLEQALDRPYTPEEGELYLFKLRLAKAEYGRDEDFNADLARHLRDVDAGGDWLLLAAARDIQQDAYQAAADHLRQAALALPASVYESRVRDYFFQSQAGQARLAPLLNHGPAAPKSGEAGPGANDPAQRPPSEGDPATWPALGTTGR